ncbi:toll/interleukin-1 receptor domain-containing protein [Nostoc sp.]
MAGLTKQEVTKIVNTYIGVFDGYLGNFSYRTHIDFYPEYCDLGIDPNQYEGTTRQRFIAILENSPPHIQAKIIHGVLQRFPLEDEDKKPPTRTKELYEELLSIAQRLDKISFFFFPDTKITNVEKEIFISYAWGGESEEFANMIDHAFQTKGITIIRDKRDLDFKGRIKPFMEKIGCGKAVILIISEKYLKSENCMFELVQIAKNGQFHERIFPILLSDANIYKSIQRIKYVQYWEQQIKELDKEMKTVGAANLQGFREDIDLYTEIRLTIAELTNILKGMNTLTPSIHAESDFQVLIKAVECKVKEQEDITVQSFIGNQVSLNDQLDFFRKQIGLVSPRQDFSKSQFEAYCNIWKSLQALRLAGDDLWKSASKSNLVKFANQLRATTKEAHDASIFFEDVDYEQLLSALKTFGQFLVGKEQLINIRSVQDIEVQERAISHDYVNEMITQQIKRNENSKVHYEKILDTIRLSFKCKLSNAA